MTSGKQTTIIFLEKYTDDIALLQEISKVICELGLTSRKSFVERYPKLAELQDNLRQEQE